MSVNDAAVALRRQTGQPWTACLRVVREHPGDREAQIRQLRLWQRQRLIDTGQLRVGETWQGFKDLGPDA